MLKQLGMTADEIVERQPPSGGCVLKRLVAVALLVAVAPAAFRRLCVETINQPPDLHQL